MNILTVPLGGLLGAATGGILWAKYIQWTGNTAEFIAIGIGVLTGIGIRLTSRFSLHNHPKTAWNIVTVASALFAIIGIFIGKYLDVQWNAVAQITQQLIQEHHMSAEQAAPIAKTVFNGQSVWELMRHRMSHIDWLYGAAAAFIAFRTPTLQFSRLLRRS